MKGILERVHKLNYLASVEASEEIVFPRVKRRLLRLKKETSDAFEIPTLKELEKCILDAKVEAINRVIDLTMTLDSYSDKDLESFIDTAVQNDLEDDLTINDVGEIAIDANTRSVEELITIADDVTRILLSKRNISGIPTNIPVTISSSSSSSSRVFSSVSRRDSSKSPFMEYDGVYIRKSTALYILQENTQLSNDRLLRVRSAQPSQLFNGMNIFNTSLSGSGQQQQVFSGDLCIFRRVDSEKLLVGRVIQFSYLGSKRSREYSSLYVDTTKESVTNIGALANWYQAVSRTSSDELVSCMPLQTNFTTGYLSMEYYRYTIEDSALQESCEFSFSIPAIVLSVIDKEWKSSLSFDHDFGS